MVAFLATFVLLSACGERQTDTSTQVRVDVLTSAEEVNNTDEFTVEETEEEAITYATRHMDELFEDFIFTFASNRRLQRQRISFPLHFNAFGDDLVIERNEWEHQDLFEGLDCYTTFAIASEDDDNEDESDDSSLSVDFERINFDDEVVRTLHFDRQDGRWVLTRQTFTQLNDHEMADFLTFYRLFTTDSLFMMRSLSNNIHFVTSDPDDDFAIIEGVITPDQWPSFAPDLPTNAITNIKHGQQLADATKLVMSIRGISNGMVDELTFSRTHNGWILTQYEN